MHHIYYMLFLPLSQALTLHCIEKMASRLFSFRISHFVFFGRNGPTGLKATWQCFHFWVNWSLKRVQPFLTNSKSWVSVGIKPEAGCSRSASDRTGLFLLLLTLRVAEQGPGFEENSICYLLIQTHSSPSRLRLGNTEAARQQCNSFHSSASFWLAQSFGRSALGLPLTALNVNLLWSLFVTNILYIATINS